MLKFARQGLFLPGGCISSVFSGLGSVQGRGGANQSFQSLLVNLVAFVKVDGAPYISIETGIEERRGVFQRGALGERQLHSTLLDLAGADDPVVRPDGHSPGVGRLLPLTLFDDLRAGLLDQSAEVGKHFSAPVTQLLNSRVDQLGRGQLRRGQLRSGFGFMGTALFHHGCLP